MKRSLVSTTSNPTQFSGVARKRRGSTLIIVLALLGLLTLLGFVFFTFASQERESAEFYSEAQKEFQESPSDGFDWGMEQLLVGQNPRRPRYNTVLNTRSSMVHNLAGNDVRPLTGEGVTEAHALANGINWTRGARNGQDATQVLSQLPAADVDYDYPDHNNPYIAYIGSAVRTTAAGGAEFVPVIIPSFMRPALMPDPTGAAPLYPNWHGGVVGGTVAPPTLSFRPNPSTLYIGRDGRPTSGIRRYLDANNSADTTIIGGLPGGSGGWPFAPPNDANGSGAAFLGEMGIWSHPTAPLDPTSGVSLLTVYELDVDNDNDGTPDSIWVDTDYPVLEDPNTSAKYTLMHSFLVLDLDALVNLNTSGNLAGFLNYRDTTAPFGGFDASLPELTAGSNVGGRVLPISRSNLGLTPSEVNPTWPMMRWHPATTPGSTTNPTTSLSTLFDFSEHANHHLEFFEIPSTPSPIQILRPVDPIEAANMELFWLMVGRGELDLTAATAQASVLDMYSGRWGDSDHLYDALMKIAGDSVGLNDFPRPGFFEADDNNDVTEGAYGDGRRAYGQPMDFDGSGRSTVATDPRLPMYTRDTANGRMRWQQYVDYS
ncbi:hypothetical protein OAH18_01900, partial [bacterium]|nr:hypothetical protein [bacterium]